MPRLGRGGVTALTGGSQYIDGANAISGDGDLLGRRDWREIRALRR